MEKKEIRVLALDLDGTLTNDQKVVTPATRTALDAAAAKGVTIVLASGRPTAGVVPLARELELDKKGGCILSYNGGSITDCATGRTLYSQWLDSKYVPALCAFAKEQKVAIVTYNEQGVVSESPEDPWALKECFTCGLPMQRVEDLAPSARCSSPSPPPAATRCWRQAGRCLKAGSTFTRPAPSSSRPCRWASPRT